METRKNDIRLPSFIFSLIMIFFCNIHNAESELHPMYYYHEI